MALVRLGRGPRHASAYICARLFAPGIWFIISVDLVPGSHCSLRLGVAVEYGKWDFTGDVHFRGCNAWFDSGYMLCNSTLIAHTFYVAADSNPEVLLSLLLQNGEACPVDAFGCSFAPRSSHLENWEYFYELHVAETRDDGQHNNNNNNNNTILGGSVSKGEEPPPHSGELKHALTQAGGPTQSQLSRPMSSGHHISMEHPPRRNHLLLNPSTNARSGKNLEKEMKNMQK